MEGREGGVSTGEGGASEQVKTRSINKTDEGGGLMDGGTEGRTDRRKGSRGELL